MKNALRNTEFKKKTSQEALDPRRSNCSALICFNPSLNIVATVDQRRTAQIPRKIALRSFFSSLVVMAGKFSQDDQINYLQ
tara:strand:+ start:169 stop:411 length:243 start_codon:yes stop_codon:yes gene_type:complete